MRFLYGAIILAALASAFVFVFTRGAAQETASPEATSPASSQRAVIEPRTPPAGQKEYVSGKYMFSLFYPVDMQVSERDEGGGASTITFQDPDTVEGFQIFIIPYADEQVSEAQFKKDIPSGIREGLVTVEVDGAIGAAFYSKDTALGETREVWFIKNTYLYEVTTLKPLEKALDAVVTSWQFI